MIIKKPIFIGGFMRSGTTLLRYLLDSHPNISCGPETVRFIPELRQYIDNVLCSEVFVETLDNFNLTEKAFLNLAARDPIASFFSPFCEANDKKRWATKTPSNILHFDFLGRLFPDAHFIHVIRDGRDCLCSLNNVDWWGEPLKNPVTFYNTAKRWAEYVETGREHGKNLNYMEITYEDLTASPKQVLAKILSFIGEDWDDALLSHEKREYKHEVRVDSRNKDGAARPITRQESKWKSKFTEKQSRRFSTIAGKLLEELGYDITPGHFVKNIYKNKREKAPLNYRAEYRLLELMGKL
ncbi:MAG TPA: sulfotransferase [Gammaproteobacteria bacterium]